MPNRKLLHESVDKPVVASENDGKWLVKLISPGQGSSGKYAKEMLAEYSASAFPAGTHSYIDHPQTDENGTPLRSPKDLLGVFESEPFWSDEHEAVVNELTVVPHFREWYSAVAPYTGLSIYAAGEMDEDENVTSLLPDPFNSVDVVSYAGRGGGMIEKLYEQAQRRASESQVSVGSGSSGEPEEYSMSEIQDLTAKVDGLVEALAPLAALVTKIEEVATVVETLKPVGAPSEDDSLAVAEAVAAEGLTPKLAKMVFESVRTGASKDDAIAEAKALRDELGAAAPRHEEGRVLGGFSAPGTSGSFLPSAWK